MNRLFARRPLISLDNIKRVVLKYSDSQIYCAPEVPEIPRFNCSSNTDKVCNCSTFPQNKVEIEHVVPREILRDYEVPLGDGHNLLASCSFMNRVKSNTVVGDFIPNDTGKGPMARAVMYTYWAYIGEVPPYWANLVEWNREFPPSDWEIEKEEEVYKLQRLSNPFVRNWTNTVHLAHYPTVFESRKGVECPIKADTDVTFNVNDEVFQEEFDIHLKMVDPKIPKDSKIRVRRIEIVDECIAISSDDKDETHKSECWIVVGS